MRFPFEIKGWAAILLLLFVAGCASMSPQAAVLSMCTSFNSALRTANTFYPQMTEEQRLVVDNSIVATDPICEAPVPPADLLALTVVRDALREVAAINSQMEAGS